MELSEFLEWVACPRCESRPPLVAREDWLICTQCGFGYRIESDIPNLLVDEAVPPDQLPAHLKS
ncbi:MAG TPA: hypothetical protein PLO61_00780 [Fimbriimonadaceae bacterium]|nr:hypothetical protein [Fimbriimonadaceae bacterium]HRJ32433.1 hypothetical protein [Fimbriimonadaceae bacterium]